MYHHAIITPEKIEFLLPFLSKKQRRGICSELYGSTTNECSDEAKFLDQYANMTEEVNPATRLGVVLTRSTTLTNERSRSGSRTQLTALYNEAVTPTTHYRLPPSPTKPHDSSQTQNGMTSTSQPNYTAKPNHLPSILLYTNTQREFDKLEK
ncbi:hypothetical protein FHG87_015965 [Trinorchestia longiramus]|nr:hypothetical protein FHG87_015965 [Trinorchestia longiramus]